MKFIKYIIYLHFFAICLLSCGTEESDSSNYNNLENPDPDGTITVSLYKNGTDNIDGLKIGKNDCFIVSQPPKWLICSLGEINGLGDISSIPFSSWDFEGSIKLGNGYVAYNISTETFYRIFINNIAKDELGTIIGYQVKYTKRFYGLDEILQPVPASLSFNWQHDMTKLQFSNTSIVPFRITSLPSWCHIIEPDYRFFMYSSSMSIIVEVDENHSSTTRTGEIELSTYNDKSILIPVSQSGRHLTATTTIAKLKNDHWTDALNSAEKIEVESPMVICGNIISSDEGGNIFKSIVVHDGSGALSFLINAYNIFQSYNMGDNISIILNDMTIGMNQGLLQIGDSYYSSWEGSTITFMSFENFKNATIFNSSNNIVKPIETTIKVLGNAICSPSDLLYWQSQYVTIKDVSFVKHNVQIVDNRETTELEIIDHSGKKLIVQTLGHCNFHNYRTPSGECDISGILYFDGYRWLLRLIDEHGIVLH